MAFEKPPVLSVLYLTLITPFWLGRIGSWGQDGTVQPQEENADVITRGSSPTFVNSNAYSPSEPLGIVSYQKVVLLNAMTAPLCSTPWALITALRIIAVVKNNNLLMVISVCYSFRTHISLSKSCYNRSHRTQGRFPLMVKQGNNIRDRGC